MGSHGARRGDDDVWERVRAGDIDTVTEHLKELKHGKRRKKELRHSVKQNEMWFVSTDVTDAQSIMTA